MAIFSLFRFLMFCCLLIILKGNACGGSEQQIPSSDKFPPDEQGLFCIGPNCKLNKDSDNKGPENKTPESTDKNPDENLDDNDDLGDLEDDDKTKDCKSLLTNSDCRSASNCIWQASSGTDSYGKCFDLNKKTTGFSSCSELDKELCPFAYRFKSFFTDGKVKQCVFNQGNSKCYEKIKNCDEARDDAEKCNTEGIMLTSSKACIYNHNTKYSNKSDPPHKCFEKAKTCYEIGGGPQGEKQKDIKMNRCKTPGILYDGGRCDWAYRFLRAGSYCDKP